MKQLRTVFNNVNGRNLPLEGELGPRGDLRPLGVLFAPSFTLRGEDSLMFRRMKGQTEGLHPGGYFNL
jgi:hypothetical protein